MSQLTSLAGDVKKSQAKKLITSPIQVNRIWSYKAKKKTKIFSCFFPILRGPNEFFINFNFKDYLLTFQKEN